MSKPRGKIVKLNLRIDAELNDALEKAGFADAEHFIKQTIRALLEVNESKLKVKWPLVFRTEVSEKIFDSLLSKEDRREGTDEDPQREAREA